MLHHILVMNCVQLNVLHCNSLRAELIDFNEPHLEPFGDLKNSEVTLPSVSYCRVLLSNGVLCVLVSLN